MKIKLTLLILISLLACKNHPPHNSQFVICDQDTILFNKYKILQYHTSGREKDFVDDLLITIEKFKCKNLDTTMIQICNIDDNFPTDTIVTRVYERLDTVYVYSYWITSGELRWEREIVDPYLWINDNDLFQFDTRSRWVTFTIGLKYTPPEIYNIKDYRSSLEMATIIGLQDLSEKKYKVDSFSYIKYLESFKGNLLTWGQPENRDGLYIWYDSLERFVLFYAD